MQGPCPPVPSGGCHQVTRTPFILIQRDDKVCARAGYGTTQLFSSAGYNYLTITIAGASALLVYIIFNSHKVNFLPIKRVTP